MEQKIIEYEGLKIVYVEIEGEKFYPISYICRHILKKSSRVNIKLIKTGKVKEMEIDYDMIIGNGSIQKTYCANEIGIKDYLTNLKTHRFKIEGLDNYIKICRYFKIEPKK